jgi:hypothetical protein
MITVINKGSILYTARGWAVSSGGVGDAVSLVKRPATPTHSPAHQLSLKPPHHQHHPTPRALVPGRQTGHAALRITRAGRRRAGSELSLRQMGGRIGWIGRIRVEFEFGPARSAGQPVPQRLLPAPKALLPKLPKALACSAGVSESGDADVHVGTLSMPGSPPPAMGAARQARRHRVPPKPGAVARATNAGSGPHTAQCVAAKRGMTRTGYNSDGPVGEHEHRLGRAGADGPGSVRVLDVGAANQTPAAPILLAVHGAHDRRIYDGLLLDKLSARTG